jgi:hypothetical protein
MFYHVIILYQHVSATTVTIIKVPYNKHTIDIQPVVQKCMIKQLIVTFNLLKGELNPTCHLLALLGAHHILQVSRIRVNFVCALHIFVKYQITLFYKIN